MAVDLVGIIVDVDDLAAGPRRQSCSA
jgi:hypothetical protein